MNLVMALAAVSGALLAQVNPPGRAVKAPTIFRWHAIANSLKAETARKMGSQTGLCAIPLLNALPGEGHYHIRTVPMPPEGTVDRMPEVQVPAPACETKERVR